MRRIVCSLAALLLTACPTVEEEEPPTPVPSVEDPSCSDEILSPSGPGGGLAAEPVEAHAETYGADPDPFQVRLQWPTSQPHISGGFLWRTDAETLASTVEWGVGDDLGNVTEGSSFVYGKTDAFAGYRVHEVRLCGDLTPGTTYSYRVGGAGGWSSVAQFTTPAEPGSFDSVTIGIAGDSRGAYTTWASVVALMEAHDPDFYVFPGDMVDLGVVQSEWDSWFEATGDVLRSKVLVPSHGNHEFLATHYFAQFSLPGNEQWFSLDYGPLHLISLNDTVSGDNDIEVFQPNFLETDLADNDSAWTFVAHHQPMYTASTNHSSNETLRDTWSPIYDANGVDVVINGHNHLYERSVPITGDAPDDDGITYIVTGGAGAPLYEGTDTPWYSAVANPIEHYIIATITGPTATFVVRDLDDNVIDEFTVTR
ncbi:MAG: metallophosphoesterase family protein [Deltaproteobacteria bacterium]|nr:metallophosphoesterase family protein [Deltaproteobacteria bacterium]